MDKAIANFKEASQILKLEIEIESKDKIENLYNLNEMFKLMLNC